MITGETRLAEEVKCYHCGDDCRDENILLEEKNFCCEGCKSVYQILNDNNLCNYYNFTPNPGNKKKTDYYENKFSYLDNESVTAKLLSYCDQDLSIVKFHLPLIHCESCIWLVEHLNKLDGGVLKSEVNFLKKDVTIHYNPRQTNLSKIASVLTLVGYEPWISLEDENKKTTKPNRSVLYKIGVAGFCFGNIMLLSFAEYFSSGDAIEEGLLKTFSYLNLILSLPVFFYSAAGFFVSSYKGLRQKFLNIDAPIALAILVTFLRSVYEILSGTGPGYMDSMSGIVFFMLAGRYFQDRTHDAFSFDKNFRSYFPLGITAMSKNGEEKQIPISELEEEQLVKIHEEEIIPADSILLLGDANIDYSFVTGESKSVRVKPGEIIYAGGKQKGGALQVKVIKKVSESYLTGLWNNEAFKKEKEYVQKSFVHKVAAWFALLLVIIAITSFVVWEIIDPSKSWLAFTSVLIIACPCTLLLSSSFTYGFMQSFLQRQKIFLKNPVVIEQIGKTDAVVFDKTGTLTRSDQNAIRYEGEELTEEEKEAVRTLAGQSSHPLSKAIYKYIYAGRKKIVRNYSEEKGKGITGEIDSLRIKMGSASFCNTSAPSLTEQGSVVYVSINGNTKGKFTILPAYRNNLNELFNRLKSFFKIAVISGDNKSVESGLREITGSNAELIFNASPHDKLKYVQQLQKQKNKVMMIGDGLNDAGALMQSDTGIVVTDNMNNFTPASDAIISGNVITKMPELIRYCAHGKTIIYFSFFISILYNIAGIWYASRAELKPVIAAILMPASSLSIILFSWMLSYLYSIPLKKANKL